MLETGSSDKLPFFLRDFSLGMDVLGYRTDEIFTPRLDPVMSARSICAFQMFTGQDAVIGCTHSPAFIIEQFGGLMRYPSDKIPVPVSRPLNGITDFSSFDMIFGEQMESAFQSYNIVKDDMSGIADVVGNITGPLTKASVLAGAETISMMMESDADVLHDMLRFCTEFTYRIIDRLVDDGTVDSFLIAAATDNPDLFGFENYGRFSSPYVKDICRRIKDSGYTVVYHPHGVFVSPEHDHSDSLLSMDIDGYHFGENNDPMLLSKAFGNKTCLLGGTDIVPTLLSDENKVIEETERYVDVLSDNRYIFMASCSLSRGVPLNNVKAMCDTVKKLRDCRNRSGN